MAIEQQIIHPVNGVTPVSELCGWAAKLPELGGDPDLLREAFDLWGDSPLYKPLRIIGSRPTAGARCMLWEVARKILGGDTPNYAQAVGDCVSFSAKNCIEYVQLFPIANGERDKWTMVFPPYLWAMGRLRIGQNRLGRQDGSMGSWQAQAVQQFGAIARDAEGVPPYSGQVARQWGNKPGPDEKWVDLGKQHIVKSAAAVTTWDELVQAICNGYPVTLCSNVGFDMSPRADGFNHWSTTWGHALTCIGVHDDASEPYACILNSWGEHAHGPIKDFVTGETWAPGTLRVRKKDVDAQLRDQDSFAYSSFDGFPAQDLPRDDFDVF